MILKGGKNMKTKSLATVVFVGVVFWLMSPAWSEPIKPLISYSKVEKGLGNKTYTFRFSLWDAETGGNMVWEEEKTLTTKKSTISTLLGDVNSIDGVDFSQALWVSSRGEAGRWDLCSGGRERTAWRIRCALCALGADTCRASGSPGT